MNTKLKQYAARLSFRISRAAYRVSQGPAEFQPGDFRAVQQFCEWTYYHFAILDNPYCENKDRLRHDVWDRQSKRIIARVKANRGEAMESRLNQLEGGFSHVPA